MVNRLIRALAGFYSRLPIKPFRGVLVKLYQTYQLANRNRIVIAKVDGITYQLDLSEMIDSSIYYNGCFEPMTTAGINKYVNPGMTALDIGANIGCHTLRLAKLVGEAGKVITFEPMSWAFAKIKINVELNDFNNIILEKLALSNISERKPVYFRTSWTLDHQSSPKSKNSEDVDFLTLDEYVSINNIDKVDFIKLDVDGYEYKVICGGRETIEGFKPIMIIELGKYSLRKYGDSLEELIKLLASLGYSFYSEKDLKQYKNEESLLSAVPLDSTINVLCKVGGEK